MTTIKDIAKAAGVSVTTVSRALNGYYDVNEKTREKIIRISRELNYSPNTLARSLVMNKSKTIGLLVSGLTKESAKDSITFEVLAGINEYASETGYDLILFSTSSTKQGEKTYSQLCRERRVDGAIIQGIRTDDLYLQEIVKSSIPCVLIDIPIHTDTVGYITTDNKKGARKAVDYLLELGHQNIAMINGHEFAFVSQQRLQGYKESLLSAGIKIREEWVVNGDFSDEVAEAAALQLLQKYPEITAVFCVSDLTALGVIKAAKKLDLAIPEQLSIVGYDDIVLSSYISPPLTTVAQNMFQMGYESAKMLINSLEGQEKPRILTLDTELIKRETTRRLTRN